MLISKMFAEKDADIWDDSDDMEDFADHVELKERLRKTLYFGKTPRMDRSSLPMTELAVQYFQESIPRELGRVDMYWASSVSRKGSISPCAMMLGMVYIERLRHKNPDYLAKMTSEELFLISMMVASKYLYDEGVSEEVYNDEWAESANLDTEDINELERDFLSAIDWHLFVSEQDFREVLGCSELAVALRQEKLQGFFTYSDLATVLESNRLRPLTWKTVGCLCKVVAVCSLAYTASTLTLAGSSKALTASDIPRMFTTHSSTKPSIFTFLLSQVSFWWQSCSHFTLLSDPANDFNVTSQTTLTDRSASDDRTTQESPVEHEDPDQKEFVKDVPKKLPSVVSQFLTLTLFKETLMAFVVGMQTSEDDRTQNDGCFVPEDRHTCRCPHCPRKNSTHRMQPPLHPENSLLFQNPKLNAPKSGDFPAVGTGYDFRDGCSSTDDRGCYGDKSSQQRVSCLRSDRLGGWQQELDKHLYDPEKSSGMAAADHSASYWPVAA